MIVARQGAELRLVTQPDHARFCGQLLSLWRSDGLPDHSRREDLRLAVSEHDNGWREADAAPRADPESGSPVTFMTMPDHARRELWERGVHRYATERPYVALLIVQHALSLHRDRRGAEWGEFLDRLDDLRSELLEATGAGDGELARDYAWLDLLDSLSLTVCSGWEAPLVRHGFAAQYSEGTLRLDPFPLAGSTTFEIPCRFIPDRKYRGDADLGGELATARWSELRLRLTSAHE